MAPLAVVFGVLELVGFAGQMGIVMASQTAAQVRCVVCESELVRFRRGERNPV
jgi:hypothetical protein